MRACRRMKGGGACAPQQGATLHCRVKTCSTDNGDVSNEQYAPPHPQRCGISPKVHCHTHRHSSLQWCVRYNPGHTHLNMYVVRYNLVASRASSSPSGFKLDEGMASITPMTCGGARCEQ